MATRTALKIRFDICFWHDYQTNQVIVEARPLDVVTSGVDEADARRSLQDALQGFLETCREMGTLDVVLEEAGYQLVDGIWEPPPVKTSRETRDFMI
ncbi:MAG TPA: hypothetical protein VH951_13510 [Dehalococcoidia bacterium]